MNNRIKELEKQAWDYAYDHETVKGNIANGGFINMNFSDAFSEKFAELIVRMCADAADMYEGKSDCVGDCVAEYMGYGQEEGVTEWRSK